MHGRGGHQHLKSTVAGAADPTSCSAVRDPAGGGDGGRCRGRAWMASSAAERAPLSCMSSRLPPLLPRPMNLAPALGTAMPPVDAGGPPDADLQRSNQSYD